MHYPLEDRASETSLKPAARCHIPNCSRTAAGRPYRMHGKRVQWPREFLIKTRGLTPLKVGITQSNTTQRRRQESYLFVTSFERVIYEATQMKARLTCWILGLSMLFAIGLIPTQANAQVVVKVGPQHHYHHRYYRHTYYRHHYHHHPYQR